MTKEDFKNKSIEYLQWCKDNGIPESELDGILFQMGVLFNGRWGGLNFSQKINERIKKLNANGKPSKIVCNVDNMFNT